MFDLKVLKKYRNDDPTLMDTAMDTLRDAARNGFIYFCSLYALLGGGCENLAKDFGDFHKNPIKVITEEPQRAILPIIIDSAIIYGLSEALDKDGGGGGAAARPSPKGPPY